MSDLLMLAREHDLPPMWDGRAVWWAGWEAQIDAFVCGLRGVSQHVCEVCGSQAKPSVNRGHVARSGITTRERWVERCEAWRALPLSERHRLPKHPAGVIELYAHRCPDCRADLVWDQPNDEWWLLDHTDYGDDGSVAP